MNKFIKILFGFCFVFIFFLIGNKASAMVTLFENETSNFNYEIASTTSTYTFQVFYNASQASTLDTIYFDMCQLANLTSLQYFQVTIAPLYTWGGTGYCPTTAQIKAGATLKDTCFSTAGYYTYPTTFQTSYTYSQINSMVADCGATSEHFFNNALTTGVKLVPDMFYYIKIETPKIVTTGNYFKIDAVNFDGYSEGGYANEKMCRMVYSADFNCQDWDLKFRIEGVRGHTYSTTFWQPATTTALVDFNTWGTTIDTEATTTDLYSYVKFWNVLTPTSIIANKSKIPINGALMSFSQAKIGVLTDGHYGAQAFIKTGGFYNTNLATSTITYFEIDTINGVKTFPDIPNLDIDVLEHICDDVATSSGSTFDDFRYGIECGARKLMYWVIYPSDTVTAKLQTAYDELKATFPFSAYFGLTDTITESATSTATNMAGTLQIPFINTSGDFIMLDVLTASSMPNMIGQTNATLFRNTLSWLMWIAVAFLIFITFKKI